MSKSSTDSRSKFDTSFSGLASGSAVVVVVAGAEVVVAGGGEVVVVVVVLAAVVVGTAAAGSAPAPEHAAKSAADMSNAVPRSVLATRIPTMRALWQHLGIANKKIV